MNKQAFTSFTAAPALHCLSNRRGNEISPFPTHFKTKSTRQSLLGQRLAPGLLYADTMSEQLMSTPARLALVACSGCIELNTRAHTHTQKKHTKVTQPFVHAHLDPETAKINLSDPLIPVTPCKTGCSVCLRSLSVTCLASVLSFYTTSHHHNPKFK